MLIRKMWRDLLQNRTQFIAIFLMALLSMLVYVGLDAESSGASIAVNKYYEQYNLSDMWIMGAGFSQDDVRKVSKLKGVESAERECYLTGTVVNDNESYLYVEFLTSNEISKMRLYDGSPYSEGEEGAWVQQIFCDKNGLKVGDNFSFKVEGIQIDTIIKGIIDSPEYVYYVSEDDVMYPNYGKCCLAFVSDTLFPVSPVTYNRIKVKLKEGADTEKVRELIEKTFDREDMVVTDRHQNLSFETFDAEIAQHKVFGIVFAIIFVLIALLGITTTMTRVTSNQRTQIGTLKALGFSRAKITWHYMSYAIVISLLGSMAGAAIGIMTIPPWILGMFEGSYLVPDLKGAFTPSSLFVIVASVVVSAAVSFLSCRKELKDPPALTLKPPAPKNIKTNFIERSFLWRMLDFSTQWNIRDLARNKLRSLMGIMGVVGCSMLLLAGFGCFDSMNGLIDNMYGELMTARYKVMIGTETSYDYSYDFSKKYKGQMIQEGSIEIVSDTEKKNGSITVIDDGNYMHFQDKNHDSMKIIKDGVAMSYKMSKNLSVNVGDYVKWHIVGDDKWQRTRVRQIYRDPSIQGIVMFRDVFEAMEYDFKPTAVLTNMRIPDETDDEISSVMDISDMKASFSETMEMMYSMIYVMVAAAVLLGVIVLYNLGVLSFVEKTREVATLKVLGFSSRKIRGILQKQNIWLTAVGSVLGVLAGVGMLVLICGTVSDTLDMYPIISIPTYFFSVVGTFVVSVSVNFMFSGKVKTIDMVDALKGVE